MPKVEKQDEWTVEAKELLKGELKRKGDNLPSVSGDT